MIASSKSIQILIQVALLVALVNCAKLEPAQWRKAYDTLVYAGPEKVDWAADEPIERTIAQVQRMLEDKDLVEKAPREEVEVAKKIISLSKDKCNVDLENNYKLKSVSQVEELIKNLKNDGRRKQLFNGAAPEALRLDEYSSRREAELMDICRAELVHMVQVRIAGLQPGVVEFLEQAQKLDEEVESDASVSSMDARLLINDKLFETIKTQCEINEGTCDEATFKIYYHKYAIAPCERRNPVKVNPLMEQLLVASLSGSLGGKLAPVNKLIRLRDFCDRYQLERELDTTYSRYLDTLPKKKEVPWGPWY